MNSITLPSFQSHKGWIQSFFLYWHDRFPKSISSEALQLIVRLLPRGTYSCNVLSDDPEKSWLTDMEYDALLRGVWENYDNKKTGTQVTLLRLLSMQYARRPVQFANLKIGDFRDGPTDVNGERGRRIHFPGAKDQKAQDNFRDSKEEVHPIADHLWDLFQIHKREVKTLFESSLQVNLTEHELRQLPFFITKTQLETAVDALTNHYRLNWKTNLHSWLFHVPSDVTARFIMWTTNAPQHAKLQEAIWIHSPLSHRTGRSIKVSANRLRHTRARQLARLGTPKHVLSFWLGHTSNASLDAYYNDPAEEARQINDAMGGALVPLAMAFTGKLIDDESQATRADAPESTVEFTDGDNLKGVGKCGKHSFCATTTVPVPCYRCKYFEPLVYAPHSEVLTALIKRQEEENAMIKIGGLRKLLAPIDLSADIRAVSACIARCEARKVELESPNA